MKLAKLIGKNARKNEDLSTILCPELAQEVRHGPFGLFRRSNLC